jgi:preprotein translocase subunit SecG
LFVCGQPSCNASYAAGNGIHTSITKEVEIIIITILLLLLLIIIIIIIIIIKSNKKNNNNGNNSNDSNELSGGGGGAVNMPLTCNCKLTHPDQNEIHLRILT